MTLRHPVIIFRQYLNEKGWSITDFCRAFPAFRFQQQTISRFINGDRVPSPAMMARIYHATEGRVTPAHFYQAEIQQLAKTNAQSSTAKVGEP